MEEYEDAIQEAEDNIDDTLEQQTSMLEELANSFMEAEESVIDVLVDLDQQKIDKLSEVNDSINDSNDRITDAIQKNIDRIRQQRENEKTEQDLSNKEKRLAYLKQDTSGSNALEIKQLEKEIKESQRDYKDELVDQSLDNFSEKLEEASNQREKMISLLEKQLEYRQNNGLFASTSHRLMNEAIDKNTGIVNRNAPIFDLLRQSTEYLSSSVAKQKELENDLESQIKAYGVYMDQRKSEQAARFEDTFNKEGKGTISIGNNNYEVTKTASGAFQYKDNEGNTHIFSQVGYDEE